MIIVRQSTARTVMIGPVLDADGAAVTDRTVSAFKVAKNGGAPAALDASATLTHRNTGHYSLALTASDLDTVGQAEIVIDDTTNACAVKEITVVEEAAYDALFAAGAAGYSTLDAAGIRTAVGLASANLDTQLSTIDAVADAILLDTGTTGVVVSGSVTTLDALYVSLYAARADFGLQAAAVRTAVGLAAANLDTQLAALDTLLDSILADTGSDGVALSAAVCNKIADHVRRRTQANVESSSDGDALSLSSLYGFIQQAQEASVGSTTLTVYQTDGSTSLGTKTLTTSSSANPVTGIS